MHRSFDTSRLEPWSLGLARTFTAHPGEALAATRRLRRFGRQYAELMKSWDVLVCPTVAHPPPLLGHFSAELPFETAYERLRRFVAFTPLQNVAGAPALSIPHGTSSEGLPIGIQLAGSLGCDRILLELGLAIEAAQPWEPVAPRARWLSGR
jgi:amidase